jgi:uncharacterized repeat protein (TIGR03803 family)
MERFGLLKQVCIIFAVCATTAIASHAQIYQVLHNFGAVGDKSSLLQATDGNFYGTAVGTVFKMGPAGKVTTLHTFSGSGGVGPNGLVQATDGDFYGTTSEGSETELCLPIDGCGTVFKITAAGALTTLYSFDVFDGIAPEAALVQGTDGDFYGTTFWGGDIEFCRALEGDSDYFGCGTVFKITAAGVLTTLHYFSEADGAHPRAALVQGTDGNFYGTTSAGGTGSKCPYNNDSHVQGCGTVFKITPEGVLTTLHSFDVTDGAFPEAALVQATDRDFYGTTYGGGASSNCDGGCGTVFKFKPADSLTTLHSFDLTDGANPEAALVQATDGHFYGTTYGGGASSSCDGGCGTVFKFKPADPLTTLHDFGTVGTSGPNALLQATDGSFYGTTLRTAAVFRLRVFLAVTFSTASLNFGNQALNEASAAKTVTLTNTGADTVDISSITTSTSFDVSSNTCEATLAVGAKCGVSVIFRPAVLAKHTGVLTFTDNAFNSPQTVALTGTGVTPVALTPPTTVFDALAVGSTSAPRLFTLTNNLNVILNNVVISTTGDFAVSSTTCTTAVAVKGKCTISVAFKPTALETRTGQLIVCDSASNSPQTAALTGTGLIPAKLLPANGTYAARTVGTTSPALVFTLTNNGTVALTSMVISTTGDFAVSSRTCTMSLAAKSKCTINVIFRPTATGTRTGQLSVRDSAANSPQTSNLVGAGT